MKERHTNGGVKPEISGANATRLDPRAHAVKAVLASMSTAAVVARTYKYNSAQHQRNPRGISHWPRLVVVVVFTCLTKNREFRPIHVYFCV